MGGWARAHLVISLCPMGTMCAIATTASWALVVRHERSDIDRCPSAVDARAVDVDLGGWAEPDGCVYVDTVSGERVTPDASLARPVETTPFRSAAIWGASAFAVIALGLGLAPGPVRRRRTPD